MHRLAALSRFARAGPLVDRALEKGEGDFVRAVAAELPLLAICELMGVPAQDGQEVSDLSNRLIGLGRRPGGPGLLRRQPPRERDPAA